MTGLLSTRAVVTAIAVVLTLGAAGGIYYKIYNDGRQAEQIKQKENYDKLKEKTSAAKDKALTATPDDVDKRLLDKYRRED